METGDNPTKVLGKTGKPKPPNAGIGRPPGVPNKATTKAREAIGLLVEANVPKMAGWLEEIERKDGPLAAWRCLEAMVEFAVPKLVRSEVDATIRRPEDDLADEELVALIERMRASRPKVQAP